MGLSAFVMWVDVFGLMIRTENRWLSFGPAILEQLIATKKLGNVISDTLRADVRPYMRLGCITFGNWIFRADDFSQVSAAVCLVVHQETLVHAENRRLHQRPRSFQKAALNPIKLN